MRPESRVGTHIQKWF